MSDEKDETDQVVRMDAIIKNIAAQIDALESLPLFKQGPAAITIISDLVWVVQDLHRTIADMRKYQEPAG